MGKIVIILLKYKNFIKIEGTVPTQERDDYCREIVKKFRCRVNYDQKHGQESKSRGELITTGRVC